MVSMLRRSTCHRRSTSNSVFQLRCLWRLYSCNSIRRVEGLEHCQSAGFMAVFRGSSLLWVHLEHKIRKERQSTVRESKVSSRIARNIRELDVPVYNLEIVMKVRECLQHLRISPTWRMVNGMVPL